MTQTLTSDSILGPPILFPGFYLYHPMQFPGKLMNQSWKNDKKPNFGPPIFFLRVLALLVIRHCSKLLFYAIYWKTNDDNMREWQEKTNFGSDFDPFCSKFGLQIFFPRFYLY